MKKWNALLLMLLAASANAQDYRLQFAEQWPLILSSEQSGAYRVVLEPQIYRGASSPQLADVQVYNAAGQALPSALLQPEQPLAQPPVQRELPWFTLPPLSAQRRDDLQLLAERDGDGRVVRLQVNSGGDQQTQQGGWLIDASVLGDQPLAALALDWEERSEPLQMTVRVDASDDLQHWRPVDARLSLVDLQRAGKRLLQRRVQVAGSVRYLRVLPEDGKALPTLRGVLAEIPAAPATITWNWIALQTQNTDGTEVPKGSTFEFTLDGRFPVRQVDVDTEENSLARWTVYSRDDPSADWQVRAGPWVAFRLKQGGEGVERTPSRTLSSTTRDRYWKLLAESTVHIRAPVLRLGYQPEVMVFLSQGAAPYAMAVGSGTVQRADAPVGVLIDDLRMRNGPEWQPTLARLENTPQALAGASALHRTTDWKTWLLWAVLILGVLLVTGLALSVLRQKPQPPSAAP